MLDSPLHCLKWIIILLLTWSTTPLLGDEGKAGLLSPVDLSDPRIGSGAGCQLRLEGNQRKVFFVYYDDVAWMNFNGSNERVLPSAQPLPIRNSPLELGLSWISNYTVQAHQVVMALSSTTKCEEGRECAGISFKGSIELKQDGNTLEKFAVIGVCGS